MSVRKVRNNANLSLSQLAVLTGIPFGTLKTYDDRRTSPPAGKARIIVDCINRLNSDRAESEVTLDELFQEQEVK